MDLAHVAEMGGARNEGPRAANTIMPRRRPRAYRSHGGWLDKFPLGAAFAKGLTLKMGQTHVHKYLPILLEHIERGNIDPSFIVTHRVALEDAPAMYRTFREKRDNCIKVVMRPH